MMTAKITSRQQKQISRLFEDGFNDACLNKAGAQRVISRDGELRARVVELLAELALEIDETPSQRHCRAMMGANFLGISEVEKRYRLIPPKDRLALAKIPANILEAIKDESVQREYIVVADIGLSILDVRDRVGPGLFGKQDRYQYDTKEFARSTSAPCWRLIRKTPVPGSVNKSWSFQQALVAGSRMSRPVTDEVPSARAMAYLIILHFLETGERLFERVMVRTGDVDSRGRRVNVGFDDDGLCIAGWRDDYGRSNDGVCIAKKAILDS